MNDFDQRWQTLATRARAAVSRPAGDPAPAGFATRVLARARPGPGPGGEDLWLRWVRPALAVMTVCGMVVLALEVRAGRPGTLGRPGVENTVAQLLWKL